MVRISIIIIVSNRAKMIVSMNTLHECAMKGMPPKEIADAQRKLQRTANLSCGGKREVLPKQRVNWGFAVCTQPCDKGPGGKAEYPPSDPHDPKRGPYGSR
jgi:hypothetical protein